VECQGVYKVGGVDFGEGLTPVAETTPLSIGNDQYIADSGGLLIFDFTNRGDTFEVWYKYKALGGGIIQVANRQQGQSASFALDVYYELDGEFITIELFNCKSKGSGLEMKQGSSSPIKFDIMGGVDREHPDQLVYAISFSS
jgi:hypothetical protein